MPWVRFDDQFTIHRKVAGMSDAAFRLHVSAIFWCARNLTDGFLPEEDLGDVCARIRTPARFAAECVERGTWHESDVPCSSPKCPPPADRDGWRIHDYFEYQPSKAQVTAQRVTNARRQARWRETHNAVSNAVSNAGSNSAPSRPVRDPPNPPQAGGDHRGQHRHCRQCGTNQRGPAPPPPATPMPPPVGDILANGKRRVASEDVAPLLAQTRQAITRQESP